jgi:hypothetical protein
MTLKKAMDKCETCFTNFQERLQNSEDITEQIYLPHQTAMRYVVEDAVANNVDVKEEGTIHYLMKRACNSCDANVPRIYNLGRAHLTEE